MALVVRNFYRHALHNFPTLTQSVQVGMLMATSDLCAQCIVEKTPINKINWTRTAKFSLMGFVFVGPSLKIWYGVLENVVSPNQKAWQRSVKKMALDQICFAPVFNAAFITVLGILQGLNAKGIKERLDADYFTVIKSNYMLWPAAQLINFSIIPLNFQVVFAQSVAVLWNTYLSWTLAGDKNKPQKQS